MKAAQFSAAFVLHCRPFLENKVIVELLCERFGRVRAIMRVSGKQAGKQRALLQPFTPLLVQLQGEGELQQLRSIEPQANAISLASHFLYSGLYLNELLCLLLPADGSAERLFPVYQQALQGLATQVQLQPLLRQFELLLLAEMGQQVELSVASDGPVLAEHYYRWHPEHGLTPSMASSGSYLGQDLLDLAAERYELASVLHCAKRLLRQIIEFHLQWRPLTSRQFFTQF